jgi:hypothetical protein
MNGLEHSLQHAAEMRLDLQNTPDLVKLSYSQSTAAPGELLTIEDAYRQGGTQLVIVGPPGSGKTTEALRLMRGLLREGRLDEQAPIPELFPLSSWARERKPILEWLADQIRTRHGRPLSEARSLVWHHQVMPVLDGLDEVAPEHREECVEEINRFWEDHRGGPLVLCCRQAEYEALPEAVKLGGAVTVCPPELDEIDRYLAAAGAPWEAVRACLREGTQQRLREVLSTPLMLSVAVLAYRDGDPTELCEMDHAGTERARLWHHYITTVTSRDYVPTTTASAGEPRYSEAQVLRWLGWLAKEMASRNETELWVHEWSGPSHWQKGIKIALGLVMALALGLAYGLEAGMDAGLRIGLQVGLAYGLGVVIAIGLTFGLNVKPAPTRQVFDRYQLALGLALGLAVALVVGLVDGFSRIDNLSLGVAFGLLGWLTLRLKIGASPVHQRPFDRRGLILGLALGLGVALVVGLVGGFAARQTSRLTYGLTYGLALLLNVGPAPTHQRPFNRRGLVLGLVVGLMVVVVFPLIGERLTRGLAVGLANGLAFGLVGGLAFALLGVGQERERIIEDSPTQAIRASGRLGAVFGLLTALLVGLVGGLVQVLILGRTFGLVSGLSLGLAVGLAVGLALGLDAIAFHLAFRVWLCMHGLGPWDWPGFLDWASDRLLLRTNGAAYQWAHLELRDYLAHR